MVDDIRSKKLVLLFESLTEECSRRAPASGARTRKKFGFSVEFVPPGSSYTQKARKQAGGEHDIPTDHHPSPEILRRSRHFWSGDGSGEPGLLPLERRHLVRGARSRSRSFLGRTGRMPGFLPASRAWK